MLAQEEENPESRAFQYEGTETELDLIQRLKPAAREFDLAGLMVRVAHHKSPALLRTIMATVSCRRFLLFHWAKNRRRDAGATNPLPARVTTKVEVMPHPLKSTLAVFGIRHQGLKSSGLHFQEFAEALGLGAAYWDFGGALVGHF